MVFVVDMVYFELDVNFGSVDLLTEGADCIIWVSLIRYRPLNTIFESETQDYVSALLRCKSQLDQALLILLSKYNIALGQPTTSKFVQKQLDLPFISQLIPRGIFIMLSHDNTTSSNS